VVQTRRAQTICARMTAFVMRGAATSDASVTAMITVRLTIAVSMP
jgi:hypothetical protein